MLGKRLFDELARQLGPRSSRRNSGPQSAKAPVTLSDPPTERTRAPEPNVATLLSLVSFGFVATATMVVFLGIGFFLLVVHPNEELNAGSSARDRGIEVEPRRADIVSRPETDAATSTVQAKLPHLAASAPSISPARPAEAQVVLPPADRSKVWASLPASVANTAEANANATSDASSNRELRGLRSNADDAALATPSAVPRAKRAGIGQHRHSGARQHWAGVSRAGTNDRPPPPLSGPEKAWRWIVQSATGILASLSPPPSQPPPGFRTR